MGRIQDVDDVKSEPAPKRTKVFPRGSARTTAGRESTVKDGSDDDVIFIKAETVRKQSAVRPSSTAVPKKSLTPVSKVKPRRALATQQSSSTSSVQKSLVDFWKPKSVETKLSPSVVSHVSTISSVSVVAVKEEYAVAEICEEKEIVLTSNVSVAEPQAGSSYFDDDSSGDELIANVPESLFSETSESYESTSSLSAGNQEQFIQTYTSKVVTSEKVSNAAGRKCPFYKLMPGTQFSVDAFNFGVIPNVAAYYLSHFHSDHYGGMTKSFSRPLYCSEITARLVAARIRVDTQWINPIPMNRAVVVDDVEVTLLDANHCPGSVLFLFRLKDGRVYLHTGDFRADPKVLGDNPHLRNLREISKIYLDTTYLDPYYEFPSQEETVQFAADVALEYHKKNPRVLICCGTYSVGKERIFMRIAEVLKCKVAVTQYKLDLLKCFQWDDLDQMLTKDWNAAQIHVLPMRALDLLSLEEHLAKFKEFTEVLAFVPSGWQFNKKLCSMRDIKPKKRGAVSVYGVPYSEHSSYRELEWFVRLMKPKEIIPTVNVGNPNKRKAMKQHLDMWLHPKSKPTSALKQNSIKKFFSSD